MVILKKHITLGDLSFDVAIDRVIAAEVFEAFPTYFELFLEISGEEDYAALSRDKKLSRLVSFPDKLRDIAKFSLPLMLKKAESEMTADEVFEYIDKNSEEYSYDSFYSACWDMAIESFFTDEGAGKKKAPFEMK